MQRALRRVKDYIAAGDIYQANLSFRARFAFLGDAARLVRTIAGGERARGALRLCR